MMAADVSTSPTFQLVLFALVAMVLRNTTKSPSTAARSLVARARHFTMLVLAPADTAGHAIAQSCVQKCLNLQRIGEKEHLAFGLANAHGGVAVAYLVKTPTLLAQTVQHRVHLLQALQSQDRELGHRQRSQLTGQLQVLPAPDELSKPTSQGLRQPPHRLRSHLRRHQSSSLGAQSKSAPGAPVPGTTAQVRDLTLEVDP